MSLPNFIWHHVGDLELADLVNDPNPLISAAAIEERQRRQGLAGGPSLFAEKTFDRRHREQAED